jgi:hypothetical protein
MKVGLVPQRMRIVERPTRYIDDNTCMDQFVPAPEPRLVPFTCSARERLATGLRPLTGSIGHGVKRLGAAAYAQAQDECSFEDRVLAAFRAVHGCALNAEQV